MIKGRVSSQGGAAQLIIQHNAVLYIDDHLFFRESPEAEGLYTVYGVHKVEATTKITLRLNRELLASDAVFPAAEYTFNLRKDTENMLCKYSIWYRKCRSMKSLLLKESFRVY